MLHFLLSDHAVLPGGFKVQAPFLANQCRYSRDTLKGNETEVTRDKELQAFGQNIRIGMFLYFLYSHKKMDNQVPNRVVGMQRIFVFAGIRFAPGVWKEVSKLCIFSN